MAKLYPILKLSFNINNIQNPFQIHYHRDQIALSFEQNLIEHTDEICGALRDLIAFVQFKKHQKYP